MRRCSDNLVLSCMGICCMSQKDLSKEEPRRVHREFSLPEQWCVLSLACLWLSVSQDVQGPYVDALKTVRVGDNKPALHGQIQELIPGGTLDPEWKHRNQPYLNVFCAVGGPSLNYQTELSDCQKAKLAGWNRMTHRKCQHLGPRGCAWMLLKAKQEPDVILMQRGYIK